MSRRAFCVLVVATLGLVAGTGVAVTSAQGNGSSLGGAGSPPVLVPIPEVSLERDTPAPVRARIERQRREWLARAKRASRQPVSTATGCVRFRASWGRDEVGPAAPKVKEARIIGHHVEVVFEYPKLPSADSCRPAALTVGVYSGKHASPTYNNSGAINHYMISSTRGRVISDLPWGGTPPYHVFASPETILGKRGPTVELSLTCPGGDRVKGCLLGYRPAQYAWTLPQPVLPVIGIDRATLERSLRYVIAEERVPHPHRARCASLHYCEITYVDPAYPKTPYRIRYQVAGEQVRSCWMAMRERILDPRPDGAGIGRLELAGCADWLQKN